MSQPVYPKQHYEVSIDAKEYAIQGKMIMARVVLNSFEVMNGDTEEFKQHVRKQLVSQLVDFMLENKFVQIVSTQDPSTLTKLVSARCFVVSSTDVQLIREKSK